MIFDADILVWSCTTWWILIQRLADRLERRDPTFDRLRFLSMAWEVFVGERLRAVTVPAPRDSGQT
jgi:hypothetical protein